MGFLNPKSNDDDDLLPGAGLHLDIDPKRCPTCRREVQPWQDRCPDCGDVAVPSSELPGRDHPLPPGLRDLVDEDGADDLDDAGVAAAEDDAPDRDG